MELYNFKIELETLCDKKNVSGTDIFLFCKKNIKELNNSDVINFLTATDKKSQMVSQIITNLCPWTAKYLWDHLKTFTTEKERVQIFKQNCMFYEISNKNIEILHDVMHTDPGIFLFYADNVHSILFQLLQSKIDLNFIFEHTKAINELSSLTKTKMLSEISETAYYASDKQKFDVVNLLMLFEDWYKDNKTYSAILKIISSSSLKTINNKIGSLLNKKIGQDALEEWNKNNKNILIDLLLNNFIVSPSFVKKCIKFQPLNINKTAKFLPLLVSKQHLFFNEHFAKSYEDIKNYVGIEKLIGDHRDQDLIIRRILSDHHLYKRYFTLFKDNGDCSSFVKILTSLQKEKGIRSDFKQVIDILSSSADKDFIKNADVVKVTDKFEMIELEFALKIVKSNIFNILLSNMKDHGVKNVLENRLIIIKEKKILHDMTFVKPAYNKKQRI